VQISSVPEIDRIHSIEELCVKTLSLSLSLSLSLCVCVCVNQRVLSQPVTISEGAMNWQALLLKQRQFLNKQVARTGHVIISSLAI